MNRLQNGSLPTWLFIAHLTALIFGLIGILVMLPNPELWSGDPNGVRVFNFSMEYAGAIHIILGAIAMLVVGGLALGRRFVGIFFVVAFTLSLTSELLGTGTGWPFGNYEYTNFLGYKVLGHVPYSIPLSWFYMGLSSYMIGSLLAKKLNVKRHTAWTIGLGVWFLTVWDLVLDPAMAHESLSIQFWVWDETGPYFGMPIKNFIGWSVTGLLYMGLSRILWKREPNPDHISVRLPLAVYIVNMGFAMVLSLSVGLWFPVVLAVVLGVIPALFILDSRVLTPFRQMRMAPDA
ncbi:MAG: carotenoid biosynthesis protein [Thermomicrobiales bacterium]